MTESTSTRSRNSPPTDTRAVRILWAGDKVSLRLGLQSQLLGRAQICTAADGDAAWQSIADAQPDLVVVDDELTGLPPLQLVQQMRKRACCRAIPVLQLSQRQTDEARREALDAGVNEYLPDAITDVELTARVEFHLKFARLRRQIDEALREGEQQFRQVIETLPAAIYTCDRDGRVRIYNRLAEQLWQRRPNVGHDRWCGSWKIFRTDGTPMPLDACPMAQALRRGAPTSGEFIIERPDGTRRNVLAMPQPLFDESGQLIGAMNMLIDISDRERAEKALHQSSERFRTLADNISQFAWMAEPDGWIFWYNQRWFEYTGTTLEQMQGWGWQQMHHPDHVARVTARFKERIAAGEDWEDEFPLRGADGQYRWFLSRAKPIRDDAGNVTRWFGTNTDITHLRATERALRDSEEQYRHLMAMLPVGVYQCEAPSGVITYFNDHAVKLWGRRPQLNSTHEQFCGSYRLWQINGQPLPHEQTPMAAALREGRSFRNENVIIEQPNGERLNITVNIDPIFDAHGRIIGAINAFHDTTELNRTQQALMESERRLSTLVSNLPGAAYRSRYADGAIQFVSHGVTPLTGYTPDELTSGRVSLAQLIYPDDFDRIANAVRTAAAERQPYQIEYRIRHRDGSLRWLWEQGEVVHEGETPVAVESFTTDITHRKHTEEALIEAHNQLEQRVASRTEELQQKTALLRKLAHELSSTEQRERKRLAEILHNDLQQYLVAVKMQLARARHQAEDSDVVATIDQAGTMMDEAIASSRNLTYQLRPPVLYEDGLVPAVRWLAGDMGRRHNLNVEVHAGSDQVPLGEDERAVLFECIRELLFNVVKHSGTAQANVGISCENRRVRVTVVDNGSGFNLQKAEDQHNQRGGLGLFSISERLEPLGGKMHVDARPNAGTRVLIQMPLAVGPSETDEPAHVAHTVHQRRTSAGRDDQRVQILVADDHAIVRAGIVNLLENDGRVVVIGEANNGAEAIDAVEQLQPDIVLMDVNMPVMNGIEATRQIRQRWPEIKVVGLSVQSDSATARSMREAGADTFLAKSDHPQTMLETILALAPPKQTSAGANGNGNGKSKTARRARNNRSRSRA